MIQNLLELLQYLEVLRVSLDPQIRSLTINRNYKFKNDLGVSLLNRGDEVGLQYGVGGYTSKLVTEFEDTVETEHSPLIG